MNVAVLICALLTAQVEKQYSGLFSPSGTRPEAAIVISPDTPEKLKARCKTLVDWSKQVKTAKSEEFRKVAGEAIMHAAVLHSEDIQKFTEGEIPACRAAGLVMLQAKEPVIREHGTWVLRIVGDGTCRKPVLALLKDADNSVQQGAADALGTFGDDSCVAPLIQAVVADADGGIRAKGLESLAKIGTKGAKKSLEELARKTTDDTFKEQILAAIDAIDNKK